MISIILPVYNGEKHLRAALESVRAQTCADFECICVDDFGQDGSCAIVEEFAAGDPRFRLVRQAQNRGVAAARNRGLAEARGEYVTFLDQDDLLHHRFLETLLGAAKSTGCGLIAAGIFEFGDEGSGLELDTPGTPRIELLDRPLEAFFVQGRSDSIDVDVWGKLYRRDAIAGIEFPEDVFGADDFVFSARVFAKTAKVAKVASPLYLYRMHPGNVTSQMPMRYILGTLRSRELVWNEIKDAPQFGRRLKRAVAKRFSYDILSWSIKKTRRNPYAAEELEGLRARVEELRASGVLKFHALKDWLKCKVFCRGGKLRFLMPWLNTWWWPRWRVPSFMMLHSVGDEVTDPDCANNTIRPGELMALIIALRRQGYTFKTFKDAIETGDSRTMCLTFDDGYVDNYRNLFPILKELKCPATCFVTDRGQDDDKFLSPPMIREMEQSGLVEFGGHTANHTMLTEVPLDKAREEIFANKAWLESVLGHPIASFCYPRGGENDAIVGLVKAAGYKYAAAMVKKMRPVAADLYRIHRQIIPRGMPTWKSVLLATRGKWKL